LKERDEAEDSLNRSADSLGLSANDLMSQSGDESTSDIIKFSRPTFDRNTYRRTYSKKEDWAIGDEELASNSGSTGKPRYCLVQYNLIIVLAPPHNKCCHKVWGDRATVAQGVN
jgi:hypothetical protein